MPDRRKYTRLKTRGLITLTGTDKETFLQSLITNDIKTLETQKAIYACFLSPQGKFFHDFFVIKDGDALLLDCESGTRAETLHQKLMMYKLRANIELTLKPDNTVYALSYETPDSYPDTRHPDMGYRSFTEPDNAAEQHFEHWDQKRIKLTIPDGSRDMTEGKSTLLESNIDKLNGISFDKGCYIGQELTARMHYRGLAKKHLYTVTGKNLPTPGDTIRIENKTIGEMRSSSCNYGLALLKDTEIASLPKIGLELFRK